MREERWQKALKVARSYGLTKEEDIKRGAKHIFAKWVVGFATIGRVNGRLVVHKERVVRPLP